MSFFIPTPVVLRDESILRFYKCATGKQAVDAKRLPYVDLKLADLPNLKPVEAREFWDYVSTWGVPEMRAYLGNQNIAAESEGHCWATVNVFFADHSHHLGGGFAVAHEYSKDERFGELTTRFYTWAGCHHKFQARTVGNCLTEYRCAKCGEGYTVDSSD